MKPRTKPTVADREARIADVYTLLLKGASRSRIIQHCTEKWGTVDRTADLYIRAARSKIQDEIAEYRKTAFEEHIAMRRDIVYRAIINGDDRLALDCLRDEAKLLALFDTDIIRRIEALERGEHDD